jgi:hypothetical protein
MIPMKHFLVAFGFILVWFLLGSESRAANYKLEKTNSPAEGLTSTLGSALQSVGYRIVDDSGKVWCEVCQPLPVPSTRTCIRAAWLE